MTAIEKSTLGKPFACRQITGAVCGEVMELWVAPIYTTSLQTRSPLLIGHYALSICQPQSSDVIR